MAISDSFAYFIKRNGQPLNRIAVDPIDVEKYRGSVPDSLIEFWLEVGWGEYLDGLLKVSDPSILQPIISMLFSRDPELSSTSSTVYAHTVFGELFVWNKQHRNINVNLLTYTLSAPRLLNPIRRIPDEREVAVPLYTFEKRGHDAYDENGNGLYDRACSALGRPEIDECFGFFPALALGGLKTISNLRRIKAREHFAILAQLKPPMVVREL